MTWTKTRRKIQAILIFLCCIRQVRSLLKGVCHDRSLLQVAWLDIDMIYLYSKNRKLNIESELRISIIYIYIYFTIWYIPVSQLNASKTPQFPRMKCLNHRPGWEVESEVRISCGAFTFHPHFKAMKAARSGMPPSKMRTKKRVEGHWVGKKACLTSPVVASFVLKNPCVSSFLTQVCHGSPFSLKFFVVSLFGGLCRSEFLPW